MMMRLLEFGNANRSAVVLGVLLSPPELRHFGV